MRATFVGVSLALGLIVALSTVAYHKHVAEKALTERGWTVVEMHRNFFGCWASKHRVGYNFTARTSDGVVEGKVCVGALLPATVQVNPRVG